MNFLKKHSKAVIAIAVVLLLLFWYSGQMPTKNYPMDYNGESNRAMNLIKSAVPAPAMVQNDLAYEYEGNYAYESYDEVSGAVYPLEDRMVITTANLTIEVEDPEKRAVEVKKLLNNVGGFLDNLSVSEYRHNKKQAYLTMRVPSDKLDELIESLKDTGYVKTESIDSRDVTSQYQENDEHINNLRAREERVREFFDRATDVEETLSVYKELASLREQIESLEGSQRSLEEQVEYSTIYLTLLPDIEINPISDEEWNVLKSFKRELNSLVVNLQGLADLTIFLLVKAVIWVPLAGIVYLIWRKTKGRKKK